jgi:glycosyltransferase 2 family protein
MRAIATYVRRLSAFLETHRRLKRAVELVAALVVIGFCAYAVRNEWGDAGPLLGHMQFRWFGLALLTVAAYYLVFVVGWLRILDVLGVSVTYSAALQAEMVSMLAKYVPGGVWTPAARVTALKRRTGTDASGAVLASILIEAVLSALAGIVVFVVSLAWVRNVVAPLVPLVVFGLLCVALLHPRVMGLFAARLLRPFGLRALPPLPFSTMLALLVFYCLTWLIGGLAVLFMIRSLGEYPGLETIPFLGGVSAIGAIVAVLAFVTPSGLGVREAASYGLLIAVTSHSTALGTTILNRLAITAVEVALFACGVVLWRISHRHASAGPSADADVATD